MDERARWIYKMEHRGREPTAAEIHAIVAGIKNAERQRQAFIDSMTPERAAYIYDRLVEIQARLLGWCSSCERNCDTCRDVRDDIDELTSYHSS